MRSWADYNRSLIQRGNFFVLISEDLLSQWQEPRDRSGRKRYSNLVIRTVLTLRASLHLSLRSVQGFMQGLLGWIKSPLPAPHYSCLCKRMPQLQNELPKLSNRRPKVLVVDSSGLKCCGCEEWLRYRQQIKTHSRWIKVHLSLDPRSQEVISYQITRSSGSDARTLPILLDKAPRSVQEVIADGAYDTASCRQAIARRAARALIRPRKGSVVGRQAYPGSRQRDETIATVVGLGNDWPALQLWKTLTRYGRRSLVETLFSRLKTRFGTRVQSRSFARQQVEVGLKLRCLNHEICLSNQVKN